jgi:hypothetical protein
VIIEAKRLGLDNAEVAQSMMMVALKDERDAAIAKGNETLEVLNHAVASNQVCERERGRGGGRGEISETMFVCICMLVFILATCDC